MKKHKLRFSKPVILTGNWNYGHPELRAAQHRAIKTRRQAIRRRLRRKIPRKEREELTCELQDLALIETQLFGVRHRETQLPLGKDGKPYVPKTGRGKLHLPITALPLDTRGRPHVPSAREIVATAVFQKFVEKGNLPMAMAKLAQIDPMAARQVQMEASTVALNQSSPNLWQSKSAQPSPLLRSRFLTSAP